MTQTSIWIATISFRSVNPHQNKAFRLIQIHHQFLCILQVYSSLIRPSNQLADHFQEPELLKNIPKIARILSCLSTSFDCDKYWIEDYRVPLRYSTFHPICTLPALSSSDLSVLWTALPARWSAESCYGTFEFFPSSGTPCHFRHLQLQ